MPLHQTIRPRHQGTDSEGEGWGGAIRETGQAKERIMKNLILAAGIVGLTLLFLLPVFRTIAHALEQVSKTLGA